MKRKIKDILAAVVYFLYEKKILHHTIRVYSIDETLDELLRTEKSMVRFGDGEIMMIKGRALHLQQASSEIAKGLAEILGYQQENLLVTIPGVFDGLSDHRKESVQFWKDHLLFYRKIYETYCNKERIYGTTFVSRCYYFARDKENCARWFAKIKKLWENKDIVVVEGSRTHNGVGNDLFDKAKSVERIICPPKDAYAAIPDILAACEKYPVDRLFLLSVGVAAKFIACELFQKGYRVLDIGNLDVEYEWYLRRAEQKIPIEKHEVTGQKANKAAGYEEYLRQIRYCHEEGR
ncbi:MAG: GT-D fold domain-containing glycosyltransferase [Bacillus sp. (in: Bacteria)]|nr:GT-D fold domain-containing glycosyltransferase [Bacillus sp. (in: firmicutes)]MCM1425492.1 GT-D fold domain-containing glycosyltransferase [Eubacterium sp.]